MGKYRKPNVILSVLTALVAACVIVVCLFPLLPLTEGSLLYAILSPLHTFFDSYLNVFASPSLRAYGLIPVGTLAVLNFVLVLFGSGILACLFRCILFYGLYLIGIYVQDGASVFRILERLPEYYHFIGLGIALVSGLFLFVIAKVKAKRNPKAEKEQKAKKEKKVKKVKPSKSEVAKEEVPEQTKVDTQEENLLNADSQSAEEPEAEKPKYEKDPLLSRRALSSLTDVEIPQFSSFQNYSSVSTVSSVDRSVYDAAEREAQIRREEQEKRQAELERQRLLEEERARQKALEEERARKEAEENRKRLENMFKPRTLMRRLSEDAQAEKSFPSFTNNISNIDFGISETVNQKIEQEKQKESAALQFQAPEIVEKPAVEQPPVQFVQANQQSVNVEIPVAQQIPPAQMQNPFAYRSSMQSQPVETVTQPINTSAQNLTVERVEYDDIPTGAPTSAVFREAAAQAEMEEQLIMRKRQAELEKKHLEEMQELERRRREAEAAAARAEEELAQAKAELARQLEEAKAAQAAQEENARLVQAAKDENERKLALMREQEEQRERERAEAEARKAEEEQARKAAEAAAKAQAEQEAQETAEEEEEELPPAKEEPRKGPDIDFISGVAGTKNASAGNSYLIDKQKFDYKFPPETILRHYPVSAKIYDDLENDPDGQIIVSTLKQFKIETSLIGIQHGPTFTLYELSLQKGIKVTSVLSYAENIAMELSVEDVRILAPIPGKPAIGIEVPNKKRDTIGFDIMMPELTGKYRKIPMVLGKTITGDSIVIDLAKTPHLLVAGTTGSGKSVCINGLICSVLFTKTPKEVRMILVDPKMVELSLYNGIPHLLTPVITDAKKALKAMNFVVEEMERRMALFSSIGAKKIEEYNEKIEERKLLRVKLPYIMVIIDEFADLMLAIGKELETSIKRITAVARFCGIHLVLATQRPSSDVITGVIKSNIPTQIAFAVSKSLNSRIIIDSTGAEKLLGRGDMLYNNPESRTPSRIQGAYIDSEIEEIVSFVKTQGEPDYIDESYFEDDDDDEEQDPEEDQGSSGEDMFSRAWKIVSDRGEASASYLQRRLGIGYNRAANLIEQMEEAGYIGPPRGSKPREILKLYGSD